GFVFVTILLQPALDDRVVLEEGPMSALHDFLFRKRGDLAITSPAQRLGMQRETLSVNRAERVDTTDLALQRRRQTVGLGRRQQTGGVGKLRSGNGGDHRQGAHGKRGDDSSQTPAPRRSRQTGSKRKSAPTTKLCV